MLCISHYNDVYQENCWNIQWTEQLHFSLKLDVQEVGWMISLPIYIFLWKILNYFYRGCIYVFMVVYTRK